MEKFLPDLFSRTYIQGLIHGNCNKQVRVRKLSSSKMLLTQPPSLLIFINLSHNNNLIDDKSFTN